MQTVPEWCSQFVRFVISFLNCLEASFVLNVCLEILRYACTSSQAEQQLKLTMHDLVQTD